MIPLYKILATLIVLVGTSIVRAQDLSVSVQGDSVQCYGEATGNIYVKVTNITDPVQIAVTSVSTKSTKHFRIKSDTNLILSNIYAGDYKIRYHYAKRGEIVEVVKVGQPDLLRMNKIKVLQLPSSEVAKDGVLLASCKGGIPPYSFLWSNNAGNTTGAQADGLGYGHYSCTVTDNSECDKNSDFMNILFFKEAFEN